MALISSVDRLTVLDFETTGSVAGYPNEPWQIGLIQWHAGCPDPDSKRESLLRVGDRPFNPLAPGHHHLLRNEIAVAPTITDVWVWLEPLLRAPLVAHNIGTERSVLRKAAPLHRLGPWVDTLKLSRMAWPAAPSHALDDLIGLLELAPAVHSLCPDRGPHDALYDACACAVLLTRLLQEPGWERLSLRDLCA